MKLTREQFEQAVEQAISRLPEEIRARMENLAVIVENRPSADLLAEMGFEPDETLFGLYTGIPLPQRSATEPPLYPDEILIFREPLEQFCRTIEELEDEIEITVAHEVAHFLGIGEERLAELGYA
ncbi:MAG: metallopeptidase family protein [Desulfobacterales bacterium]|nr:metallopeptidase family protein [Desulfobacterales bacterium]